MTAAATFGGWVAAGAVAAMALLAWRALGKRMEAIVRACHELRGPITAARLGLELGSRTGELPTPRLRAIDAELGRACLALDDLDGARDGRFRPRELVAIDLHQLLADSVEAWRPSAAAAGKQLRLRSREGPLPVAADRLRLAQAAGNLIANAIEHGGAEVDVLGWAYGATARIEVIDDGPGLPATLPELARSARHGRGVHGRGLAIVADIAAAHGGSLTVTRAERSTRLVLELPAGPVADGAVYSAGCRRRVRRPAR